MAYLKLVVKDLKLINLLQSILLQLKYFYYIFSINSHKMKSSTYEITIKALALLLETFSVLNFLYSKCRI